MSLEKEETFTIMWRIKNFSMCPGESDFCIDSPVIRVRQFGNTEWNLRLLPKVYNAKGYVSCFLKCKNLGIYENESVKILLTGSVIRQSSTKVGITPKDIQLEFFGFDQLILIENILEEKNDYLPNDTLTIKCSMKMKCKNPSNSKNTEEEIIEAFSRELFRRNLLNFNECCIETVIHVQTKSLIWPIGKFQSLPINKRITMPVFSATSEIPSVYVTLFKTDESLTCIEIKRKKDDISKNIFVKCSVSVANAPKDVNCEVEDEFLFRSDHGSDSVWKLPTFLNSDELGDKYFKPTKGVLYLHFDFAFSTEGKMHHSEKTDWNPVCLPPERQVQLDVLTSPTTDDDEPSLVSLRTHDQTFKVHKSILTSSSEVFTAMFENDMAEKKSGIVDIPDVEPQTLGLMVAFLHSGTVGDISTADCGKLYAAADKYQVLSLIDHCSSILVSSMTVSNVCDILSLADLYGNDQLLKCAKSFIVANSDPDKILMSTDWKNLMENNSSLAANVMYNMLIK